MLIYENNHVKLEKNKTNNYYKLNINKLNTYKNYINWVSKNIKGEVDNDNFIFKANNIDTLENLLKNDDNTLSYHHVNLIFLHLCKQLKQLEMDGFGILQIKTKDIFVVSLDKDDIVILFLNFEDIQPIVEKQYEIMIPFDKNNLYNSPEILSIKELPCKINYYKSIIYSIAVLVIDCLNKLNKPKDCLKEYKKHMESILGTKLYWALIRCLEPNFNDRFFLYI